MLQVVIEVTSEDIARGERCDAWRCPLALAAHRATGDSWSFRATAIRYYPWKDGRFLRPVSVRVPRKVASWISAYDSRRPVQPARFLLKVPDDA